MLSACAHACEGAGPGRIIPELPDIRQGILGDATKMREAAGPRKFRSLLGTSAGDDHLAEHASGAQDCSGARKPGDEALFCAVKQRFQQSLEPPQPRLRDCAVVSSSGALGEHAYGAEIDAHEHVFRVNGAPVGGRYAKAVGGRREIDVLEGFTPEGGLFGRQKDFVAELSASEEQLVVLSRPTRDQFLGGYNGSGVRVPEA